MRQRLGALLQWIAFATMVGVLTGSASALFLLLLDQVTRFRESHQAVVYGLPVAGLVVGWLYDRYGATIAAGTGLIFDAVHVAAEAAAREAVNARTGALPSQQSDDGAAPDLAARSGATPGSALSTTPGTSAAGGPVPLRMAPMVLLGTLITHLFGGSAGREGTAVQMGAGLADALFGLLTRWSPRSGSPRWGASVRHYLLVAGIAGGFGSVFGTPVAGAVFALEVVVIGRIEYVALVPALIAALVGDMTTRALGATHSEYPSLPALALTPWVCAKWLVFAAVVALVTATFIELTHGVQRLGARFRLPRPWRLFVGGVAVVGLWRIVGTSEYLGLGVPSILRALSDERLPTYAFALKLLFTAITVGSGFLGGEVTPLFFIGASLGNLLARALQLPLALGAGVGLAAVFASAANAPLALSIMAVELFGARALPHVMVVNVVAYLLTGHRGIYPTQRLWRSKAGQPLGEAS